MKKNKKDFNRLGLPYLKILWFKFPLGWKDMGRTGEYAIDGVNTYKPCPMCATQLRVAVVNTKVNGTKKPKKTTLICLYCPRDFSVTEVEQIDPLKYSFWK